MKERYRLFLRRKSVYYAFDITTRTYSSLKTKNKAAAKQLIAAKNAACERPEMNLSLARVYLQHSDPMVSQRTWQHVMDEIIRLKTGNTQYRWQTAAKDKPLTPRSNAAPASSSPTPATTAPTPPSRPSYDSRQGTVTRSYQVRCAAFHLACR